MRDATKAKAQLAVAGLPAPRAKAKANMGEMGQQRIREASRQRAREAAVVARGTTGELAA